MRMAEHDLPDTAAVRAALDVARRYQTSALLAHCIRSWYWAVGFAAVTDVPVTDPELLAVAALLHDIGLVPEFDAVRVPYESAGGHVAAVLAAGAGWAPDRRDRVARVIERHMWPQVDPAADPEGHLLGVATSLDISGARPQVLPLGFLSEVLTAHPRGDLAPEFSAHLLEQAARKSGSHAERIVRGGVVERLAEHPLDRIGRRASDRDGGATT